MKIGGIEIPLSLLELFSIFRKRSGYSTSQYKSSVQRKQPACLVANISKAKEIISPVSKVERTWR
jgi:hypothetical protein